jgi:hypothetical protein
MPFPIALWIHEHKSGQVTCSLDQVYSAKHLGAKVILTEQAHKSLHVMEALLKRRCNFELLTPVAEKN